MATNRIRRTRKMIPEVKPAEIHYLKTGDDSQARDDLKFEMFVRTDADWEKIWETVREEILAEWIKKAPCTRPFAWWSWTAPRWTRRFPGWYFDGKLPGPRRRLGGVGTEDFAD